MGGEDEQASNPQNSQPMPICRVGRKGPELASQDPAGLEEGDTQEAPSLGTCHMRNEQSRCGMHSWWLTKPEHHHGWGPPAGGDRM